MALLSRIKTWVSEVLTASDLNAEFDNIINNGLKASKIVGSSADTTAMQSVTDPGELGTESLASDVEGEIKRLRSMIKEITGEAQWYVSASNSLASIEAQFPVQTADIGDLQVTTGKLAADAVTGAKIADDQIDSEHYVADSIDTEHYAPGSIDATALASSCVTDAKVNDVSVSKISDIGANGNGSGSTSSNTTLVSASSLTVSGNICVVIGARGTSGSATILEESGGAFSVTIVVKRDSTVLYTRNISAGVAITEPIIVIDTGGSGAHTYSIAKSSGSGTIDYNLAIQAFHVS